MLCTSMAFLFFIIRDQIKCTGRSRFQSGFGSVLFGFWVYEFQTHFVIIKDWTGVGSGLVRSG